MSNQSFGFNSNVTIKIFDENNRLKSISRIHNKATELMVQGVLQYLQGNFTGSQYNKITNQTSDAWRYVPCYISLGDGGLSISQGTIKFEASEDPNPTYDDRSLVRFLTSSSLDRSVQVKDNTHQDCGAILLSAIFDKSFLGPRSYNVKRVWDNDSESSIKSGCLITELGLMAGPNSSSNLLARVALNSDKDENGDSIFVDNGYPIRENAVNPNKAPIFKRDDRYIIVEWRIGIVSIGSDDEVTITQSNN